jgi:hypothetical protein
MQGLNDKPQQLGDVLARIAERESWQTDEEEFLHQMSAENFYNYFANTKSPNLHSYIRMLLLFGTIANSNERQTQISETAKSALRKIAEESLINKLRLRRHNLEPKKA